MQVVINGRKGHTIIVKYVVKRLSNAKGDNMKRNNKWLDLVLNEFFQKYNKPPLMPPSWVFPVVWVILYAVMGVSAHLIHYSDAAVSVKRKLLTIYWVQLIVNFLWSIIFVHFELLWLAAADIVLLLVLIGIMILGFGKVNRIAGDINIPYFLWVAFATYLNVATIFVN